MELRTDTPIPFPPEVVFAAYRDDLSGLLAYLPNVRSIDVKSRTQAGPLVELVNAWRGGGDIPAAVRAVVSESVLSWTDYATWNADALRCDWRIEPHALTDALRCSGHNLFLEDGPGKTRLEVHGSLELDPKKLRGVPSFLAGRVAHAVEEFLVKKIQSNLVETATGLTKYLSETARTSS